LELGRTGNNISLAWESADAELQRADAVIGPWTVVTGAQSPWVVTVNQNEPEHYYRLFYPNDVQIYLGAFESTNGAASYSAYHLLFGLGRDAIDPLLSLANSSNRFSSTAFQNERSSRIPMEPLPVPQVVLYLVDGILRGDPQPHYTPTFVSTNGLTEAEKLDRAINANREWWSTNNHKSLLSLQQDAGPLDGTDLLWNGPVQNDPMAGDDGTGTRRAGSATPWDRRDPNVCLRMVDGADVGDEPDDYAWIYKPQLPNGPAPYNCLAWAVNCYTNRWLDVPLTPTMEWKEVLTDHGYDVAGGPVDCSGKCPDGRGPKIKMIWHLLPDEEPTDANWQHAMKQEDDGDWSSKNGYAEIWENITDCEKFLDKYYKVPRGRTRVVQCYCK
jgi:hypothetical protein